MARRSYGYIASSVIGSPVTLTWRAARNAIFRTVFWHSIAGAAVIGVIAMLQAYVFPGMIPIPPLGK